MKIPIRYYWYTAFVQRLDSIIDFSRVSFSTIMKPQHLRFVLIQNTMDRIIRVHNVVIPSRSLVSNTNDNSHFFYYIECIHVLSRLFSTLISHTSLLYPLCSSICLFLFLLNIYVPPKIIIAFNDAIRYKRAVLIAVYKNSLIEAAVMSHNNAFRRNKFDFYLRSIPISYIPVTYRLYYWMSEKNKAEPEHWPRKMDTVTVLPVILASCKLTPL